MNDAADFMTTFSNLMDQLSTLTLQPKPSQHLSTFNKACNSTVQLLKEELHHPDMREAFRIQLPFLVQLTDKCYRFSKEDNAEAMAYARYTEALLETIEHCSSGAQRIYLPMEVKIPAALIQKKTAECATWCRQLQERWTEGKMESLISVALAPLYKLVTATPQCYISFAMAEDAVKHYHNLQTAGTESELLSVLYGINYNTDAFIHWQLQYMQERLDHIPFANEKRNFLATVEHEMQMTCFNPEFKKPFHSYAPHNNTLYKCMQPFFARQYALLAETPQVSVTDKINVEHDSMVTIACLFRAILAAAGLLGENMKQKLGIISTIFCFKNMPVTDPDNFSSYAQPKRLTMEIIDRLIYILEKALEIVHEWKASFCKAKNNPNGQSADYRKE